MVSGSGNQLNGLNGLMNSFGANQKLMPWKQNGQNIFDRLSKVFNGPPNPPAPGKNKAGENEHAVAAGGMPPQAAGPDHSAQAGGKGKKAPTPGGAYGPLSSKTAPTDMLDIAGDKTYAMQYSRVQFEVNYQSLRAISGANGIEMEEINFSFSASFETLQAYAGQGPIRPQQGGEAGEVQDPFQMIQDYFSPEKTAGRILDFALSFFPGSQAFQQGGDTQDARQGFAELMGGAIQKGFDQALGMLGELPEKVQSDVDKTHDIVFSGLDDFVENGMPEEKAGEGGAYASIQAYAMEVSMSYSRTTVQYGQQPAAESPAPESSSPDVSGLGGAVA